MDFTFLDVFLLIGVMLLMIIPGFLLRKLKMVEKSAVSAIVIVLLYVCQPFLTIKSFVLSEIAPSYDIIINMLIMFGLAFLVHLVGFFVVKIVFIKNKDKLKSGSYTMCSLFSNAGFIGIPFVEILTNNHEAVIYATVFMCVFNMLIWTLGIYAITGELSKMKPLKGILNPAVIVLLIALPLYFIPSINIFKKISVLGEGIKFFASATLPLSMIIVGMRMADIPLKSLFNNIQLYFVALLKLVVAPLITLAIVLPFFYNKTFINTDPKHYIIIVLIMLMAIPPAASSIAMSERFRGDVDTAVEGFILSTIASIITLPILLTFLLHIIK